MYITTAELTANGITWDNTYLTSLIARSEAIFNTLIGYESGVMSADHTDEFYWAGGVSAFRLRQLKPTVIKKINGGATLLPADYKIVGQEVFLKDSVSSPDTFPYAWTIEYTAGYTTAPDDIKQVVLSLAWYITNTKNSQGISNFRQDLLSVSYGWATSNTDINDYIESTWQSSIINKYKNFYAYSL